MFLALTACSSPDIAARPPGSAALDLAICPIRVANAPDIRGGKVTRNSPLACIHGVTIAVAPAPGACLSSGFGPRAGRVHYGIDYQSQPAGPVIAAAAGVVRERQYRAQDFGNFITIDHGRGIHTGYAHLASVAQGIHAGAHVERGQVLGIMGRSGVAARAIHLHFELREGGYENALGWWGLRAVDPFSLPARCR